MKAYATYRIPGDGLARLGAIAELAVWERPDPVPAMRCSPVWRGRRPW